MVARAVFLTFGLLSVLALCPIGAHADSSAPKTLLTNASQVRALTSAQAVEALPVVLRGVVLDNAFPYGQSVILADGTASLYLLANTNQFTNFTRGDFLEIHGVTDPGGFAPIVKVTEARKIGGADLPQPRPVSYHELLTGSLDAQWIEISGVVRRYLGSCLFVEAPRVTHAFRKTPKSACAPSVFISSTKNARC
jgi:hypothetical protein